MTSYKKAATANIATLARYADELSDAALTRAVYRNQNDPDAMYGDLWGLLGSLVGTDNPGKARVSSDKRSCLRSRYNSNRERWDTLRRWKSNDCDSEYRALYASEYRMLCYYATKALVDLYGEAVN